MAMKFPKFLENKDWYIDDQEEYFIYILTENAPEEVYDSYFSYLDDMVVNEEITDEDRKNIIKDLEELKSKKLFGL